MNRLLEELPPVLQDIIDFQAVTSTEAEELNQAVQSAEWLLAEQFVMTASESGVRRRERMLNIRADRTAETLDFRRLRLINRYSTKPPFTLRYLQDRLDFLVGEGMATASIDVEQFVLSIAASIENAAIFKELEHTVAVVKPANIVYRQETALADTLVFEERITKRTIERNMRLSTSWRLGRTPFAMASEEVVIR